MDLTDQRTTLFENPLVRVWFANRLASTVDREVKAKTIAKLKNEIRNNRLHLVLTILLLRYCRLVPIFVEDGPNPFG